MAANTYVALDKQTISGTTTPSITFTSIPQTYTDLRIVFNGGADGNINLWMQFNGDSGSNYSYTYLTGDGTSATSGRSISNTKIQANYYGYMDTGFTTNINIDVMNYANSTTYKTAICRASNAGNGTAAVTGLWRGSTGSATQAITSITLTAGGGNFKSGSTFSLYGVKADDNTYTAKATGGTVTADANYIYHTFTSTANFVPTQSITADVLVVAGGGAGGGGVGLNSDGGGGGGAGGLSLFTSQSLTATTYGVTVGGGGTGGTTQGGNGSNSQFASLTASVGGGGGGYQGTVGASGTYGKAGGSGGGSTGQAGGRGGAATLGQGYRGGGSYGGSSDTGGAGGGGAGAQGVDVNVNGGSTNSAGTNGGVGSALYSAWGLATSTGQNVSGTYYYAGGGGAGSYNTSGGSGGYGGGGAGGTSNAKNQVAGTANTGGGGGGAELHNSSSQNGANGGSGVVIIRYAK